MIGVLLMYYGTPSGPEDVERYYTDIRGGNTPSPELVEDLKRRYAAIGNTFPLNDIARRQAEALEAELNGDGQEKFRVYLGAKHSPPFVADAVREMAADDVREGVGLVLAPHYSKMSIGSYIGRAEKARPPDGPALGYVESWHLHPAFLEVLTGRVRDALATLTDEQRGRSLVVFTAHSLPARIAEEGDPYPAQLSETAGAVASELGLTLFTTAWQSAARTGEPWLTPSLVQVIEEAGLDGIPAVVVCPCGFVADHLEVLYDVDIEAQEAAAKVAVHLVRTESMNDDPAFIRALGAVVRDHLTAEA